MTFAELVAAIVVITNRPDLVAETEGAIRKATIKAHGSDFFPSDSAEVIYTLPASLYAGDFKYQIDVTTAQFIRLRTVDSIRVFDTVSGQSFPFLSRIENNALFDSYHAEKQNYWYQAGKNLCLRLSAGAQTVAINYWQYPDTAKATYKSWIADTFPDCIIEEAAAQVFKMIGKDEEFNRFQALSKENLHMLQMTQLP